MPINELIEQEINARSMEPAMFNRLQETITRDGRLEQLPFCALTERGIEIVSGHHRVRAARASDLKEIVCLVDVTGLTRDQIAAKQLAHNSISGRDDPQLVRRIYSEIKDIASRLESFINPDTIGMKLNTHPITGIDVGQAFRTVLVMFMPTEHDAWEAAIDAATKQLGDKYYVHYIAELERLNEWKAAIKRTGEDYDIRSIGTIFSRMAEIVLAQLGEPLPEDERIALRDVLGMAYVTPKEADAIKLALSAHGTDMDKVTDRREAFWSLVNAKQPAASD